MNSINPKINVFLALQGALLTLLKSSLQTSFNRLIVEAERPRRWITKISISCKVRGVHTSLTTMTTISTVPIFISVQCAFFAEEVDWQNVLKFTSTGHEFNDLPFRSEIYSTNAPNLNLSQHLATLKSSIEEAELHRETFCYVLIKLAAPSINTLFLFGIDELSFLNEIKADVFVEVWEDATAREMTKLVVLEDRHEQQTSPLVTYMSLRIAAETLDPDQITAELGLQPDDSFRAGDLYDGRTLDFGKWSFSSKNKLVVNTADIGAHVTFLVSSLGLEQEIILRWKKLGYLVDFLLFWEAKSSFSMANLKHQEINLLQLMGTRLILDIYF